MLVVIAAAMLVACSPSTGPADAARADTGLPGMDQAATAPATEAPPARSDDNTPEASAPDGRGFEPGMLQVVQGAAKIAASSVACGLGTRAQAEEGFAAQRAGYVEQGYSAAAYDGAVDAAFREVEGKFAQASAAEKAQACESIKRLGEQFNRMGEEMLRRQGSTP